MPEPLPENPRDVSPELLRELREGCHWSQRVDQTDPRFVIVEFRIATRGMPEHEYKGPAALDRLLRFCRQYLRGAGG